MVPRKCACIIGLLTLICLIGLSNAHRVLKLEDPPMIKAMDKPMGQGFGSGVGIGTGTGSGTGVGIGRGIGSGGYGGEGTSEGYGLGRGSGNGESNGVRYGRGIGDGNGNCGGYAYVAPSSGLGYNCNPGCGCPTGCHPVYCGHQSGQPHGTTYDQHDQMAAMFGGVSEPIPPDEFAKTANETQPPK